MIGVSGRQSEIPTDRPELCLQGQIRKVCCSFLFVIGCLSVWYVVSNSFLIRF